MSLRPRGICDDRNDRLVCRGGDEARRVLHLGIDQGDKEMVKRADVQVSEQVVSGGFSCYR